MADNERAVAVSVLMEIDAGGFNNIILRKALGGSELSREGSAFVTEAVNGILRNRIYIDYVINSFSKTKTAKMKPFVRNNLRLGVYQLLFMDRIPASAACNEAVKLMKQRGMGGLSGFVNAILRNVARSGEVELPEKASADYLAIKYSYPQWLAEMLLDELGRENTERMMEVCNTAPEVTICTNTHRISRGELKQILEAEGVEVSEGRLDENALRLRRTANITELAAYRRGLFHVMDESAMLAVRIAEPSAGSTILDICAAPGGKSFLAAYLSHDSATIYSRDLFPHKIELVNEGKKRIGMDSIKTSCFDATKVDENLVGKCDLVIADLPCSGLGLIRKKPDIKYTKTAADITELVKIQRKILSVAQIYVKSGGILLYSTCTLTNAENTDNLKWILDEFPFTAEDLTPITGGMKPETAIQGYIQILPQDYDSDGFFIARLRKHRTNEHCRGETCELF